ncbi:SDR family NAD(P)-dependent oxidoreductase [Sporolactobacillus terrae]|uniref:SDR family oxidoreductase n=1 Tax=Sporolactobacillus terrae TaxID=269673 RepID=A0ABX5Q5D0_9BACL|nr:SDR family NAD(P)-dependent oxidoreductase [Sporolactobacillus terrae]QAA21848.1 SDR family oxidoreductase [Sporolactobacillus terrae]QAA24821.1 SDR family oxidoreductase [Sporolactobacillus terrae]
MKFTNEVAIVTGGAQGIGKEVVKGIVNGGGRVIIVDINEGVAKQTVAELGEKVTFYRMDLSAPETIREVIAAILKDYKKIDILVNCAGIVSTKKFEDLDDAEWQKVIQINLTGTFTTIHALFPHFIKNNGGRIVNVSSVAGKIGGGLLGTAAYASSKAGVNGLTKAVAKEGGKYHIHCNAVCPSYTNTTMTTALSEDADKKQKVLSMIPLGRRAEPVEIAQMILFFASNLASFVNGEVGDVDGGIVLDG